MSEFEGAFSHPFLQKITKINVNSSCLIKNDKQTTYEELINSTQRAIKLLENVKEKSIVGIYGDFNENNIAMFLACVEKRHIVVPIYSNLKFDLNDTNLQEYITQAQISYIYHQNKIYKIEQNKQDHAMIKALRNQNSSGLILFSSGSTGKPKAIVHSLDILLQGYLHKKVKPMYVLLFLMFDHIGGLNTLFNVLSMGACGIALQNRKDMIELARSIQRYKISLLPASPSLLNLLLLSNVKDKFDLNSLRVISYGTEKMPSSLLARLKQAFPKVRFHQTFGTSEIGISQTSTKDEFIRLDNVAYKIINNELFIKSPTQALGYLNADNSVFDENGYFATGDLVESFTENNQEYIKIIGRSKEIINVGGEKVLPTEIEEILLQIPQIEDCLVFGETNVITGQSVSAKIVLKKDLNLNNMEAKKMIRLYCKNKLANFKIPSKVEVVPSLEISARFKKIRNGGVALNESFFSPCFERLYIANSFAKSYAKLSA